MAERRFENLGEIAVGAVVLVVALGFALYAAQVAGPNRVPAGYLLTASFRSVDGIAAGSDVRLAGIRIGSVSGMELDLSTLRAELSLRVQGDVGIPDDSTLNVASDGLMGAAYIQVVPGGSPDNFVEGDRITDTQGGVSLMNLLLRFATDASK